MLLGSLPPPKVIPERARLIAAGALALLAVIMALMFIVFPPQRSDAAALRAELLPSFQADVGACRAALEAAGFATEALPNFSEGPRCGYADAVALTQSVHQHSSQVSGACALAAALALWERDVVAPAAQRHFGQSVARIDLAGSVYACRQVAGRNDRRMSEHARANAIDVGGFTLADGRRVTVASGWRGGRAERAFLREVRDGACERFQAVLSPEYNRAHRDHLHFDLGRDKMCR